MDQRQQQQQQQQQQRRSNVPSERNAISRPQMFMHLEFGLSWSQRHAPQKHTITYTSRNLRDSRSRSSFPRQLPPPNANFLGPDASTYQPRPRASPDRPGHHYQQHQQQQQQHQQHHQQQQRRSNYQQEQEQEQQRLQQQQQQQHLREYHHRQSRGYDPSIQFTHRPREVDACEYAQDHERRRSRSESRGLSHDRGHSAPPPFHDSPWDDTPGLSASLFPPAQPAAAVATAASGNDQEALESVSKPLPATPSHFRLGEDGLPWSADAWPADTEQHGSQEQSSHTNQPATATVGIASGSRDDPQRVKELETLSAAMVTVDNGFENQWWYQGPRETTAWWPRDQEEPSRLSLADDLLFSATTDPADRGLGDDWYGPLSYNEESPLFDGIVSPVSTASPARPLQRSMTTRSEELFIMSDSR